MINLSGGIFALPAALLGPANHSWSVIKTMSRVCCNINSIDSAKVAQPFLFNNAIK